MKYPLLETMEAVAQSLERRAQSWVDLSEGLRESVAMVEENQRLEDLKRDTPTPAKA